MTKTQTKLSVEEPVRGRAKSGRVWKENKDRFSNLTIQKPQRSSWEKKMALKNEKKLIKQKEAQMKIESKQRKIDLHERQKLNEKRRLENERKSEIVQIVKDPKKLKKIKKKQLRMYEKRDLSKLENKNKV